MYIGPEIILLGWAKNPNYLGVNVTISDATNFDSQLDEWKFKEAIGTNTGDNSLL